jgi:periplasmic divalent cation tolerance protein
VAVKKKIAKKEYVVLFVTAASSQEAENIAQSIIKEKLAACVNIINGVKSLFWWEGKIDAAEELLLVIKTRRSCIPELIPLIKSQHSYTVPEIIALPILAGNSDYLEWIYESTR